MKGLELRAQDLGCKVQGLWCGIWGGFTRPITLNPEDLGLRISECCVRGWCLGLRADQPQILIRV